MANIQLPRCATPELSDRQVLIRAWVADNYSDESKYNVANGYEPTREDSAKFEAAEASGSFG